MQGSVQMYCKQAREQAVSMNANKETPKWAAGKALLTGHTLNMFWLPFKTFLLSGKQPWRGKFKYALVVSRNILAVRKAILTGKILNMLLLSPETFLLSPKMLLMSPKSTCAKSRKNTKMTPCTSTPKYHNIHAPSDSVPLPQSFCSQCISLKAHLSFEMTVLDSRCAGTRFKMYEISKWEEKVEMKFLTRIQQQNKWMGNKDAKLSRH